MHQVFLTFALIASGCAGTGTSERGGGMAGPVAPIIRRDPSLISRWQYARQREEPRMVDSEVSGNLTR